MNIFPELDTHYIKSGVTYELTKQNPETKKDVVIKITVHLDSDIRKVTIHGKNKDFEFIKSKLSTVRVVNELIEKGLELAGKEQRIVSPESEGA